MSEKTTGPLHDLRVLVACGGRGAERDGSKLSAAAVADILQSQVQSIEVADIAAPDFFQRAISCDIVFNACHGLHGEDGALQGAMDLLGISYTGSRALTSAICMDKEIFKQLLLVAGLPTAPWRCVDGQVDVQSLAVTVSDLDGPWFVKPVAGGESFASGPASSVSEIQAIVAGSASPEFDRFLIEPLTPGPTYTVAVWRNGTNYVDLPILEARTDRVFYDPVAKQDPTQRSYHCPAWLDERRSEQMVDIAHRVYEMVRAESLIRVDFLLSDSGPIVLEANTIPGFTRQGNLATILDRSGHDLEGFVVQELLRVSPAGGLNDHLVA